MFPNSHPQLRTAIRSQGHAIVDWDDMWWIDGIPKSVPNSDTVFHGSLGNAAKVESELKWNPGSFCPVDKFRCSAWYESARTWLLQDKWEILPANIFVDTAQQVAQSIGETSSVFVRPDSPLKPFSGRVVDVDSVTLKSLDHGFYYDEEDLEIIIAPIRSIHEEWRFVVANQAVVTGCRYESANREGRHETPENSVIDFANSIAAELPPPAEIYILDVCNTDGELFLLELNPFGGADLYTCDMAKIVSAIENICLD